MVEILGRNYAVQMGSDLERDGMFLEICDNDGENIAEIFYSDIDGGMTFTGYRFDLPLPLVEWLIAEGKRRLPPPDESNA